MLVTVLFQYILILRFMAVVPLTLAFTMLILIISFCVGDGHVYQGYCIKQGTVQVHKMETSISWVDMY